MIDPYWRKFDLLPYNRNPEGVVDGDTISCLIDLGFHVQSSQRIRLYGVDTAELRGGTIDTKADARRAKQFVIDWFEGHRSCSDRNKFHFNLQTGKGETFGRFVGTVQCCNGHDLQAALIDNNFSEDYRN